MFKKMTRWFERLIAPVSPDEEEVNIETQKCLIEEAVRREIFTRIGHDPGFPLGKEFAPHRKHVVRKWSEMSESERSHKGQIKGHDLLEQTIRFTGKISLEKTVTAIGHVRTRGNGIWEVYELQDFAISGERGLESARRIERAKPANRESTDLAHPSTPSRELH